MIVQQASQNLPTRTRVENTTSSCCTFCPFATASTRAGGSCKSWSAGRPAADAATLPQRRFTGESLHQGFSTGG
eukprot:gene12575-biopygen1927